MVAPDNRAGFAVGFENYFESGGYDFPRVRFAA